MVKLRRGILLFSVVLAAAAVAIIAAAASTSWWVLLVLVPLAMVVGCVAMVGAGHRIPCGSGAARCGWGGGSALPTATCGCRPLRSERTADANG